MRPDYVITKGLLSQEECDRIIRYGSGIAQDAAIGGGRVSWIKRKGKVGWITDGSELQDLMERLIKQFCFIAREYYDVGITNVEPIQYTEYGFLDHYGWHMDAGLEGKPRLISASIELSDPSKYVGGGLKFYHHPRPVPEREQGTMISFPSLMMHKARPIFWGKRSSLVLWGGY
jgi:predicted 2-oxoglutarate/Fe(II)-dependent dioxygenase YbiX